MEILKKYSTNEFAAADYIIVLEKVEHVPITCLGCIPTAENSTFHFEEWTFRSYKDLLEYAAVGHDYFICTPSRVLKQKDVWKFGPHWIARMKAEQ